MALTDHSFAALLERVDDATERADASAARRVLDAAAAMDLDDVQRALLNTRAAFLPGSPVGATELRRARTTLLEAGLRDEVARADGALGTHLLDAGDPAGAADAFAAAESGFAGCGDAGSVRRSQLNRAAALIAATRLREALAVLTRLDAEIGSDPDVPIREQRLLAALIASNTAAAHLALGAVEDAERELNRAAELYVELDLPHRAATVVFNEAFAANRADRPELALRRYRDAARLFDRAGDPASAMAALRGAGSTAATLGRIEETEAAYGMALRYFRARGSRREVLRTVIGLAAARAERDPVVALELLAREVTDADRADPNLRVEVADAWHNRGSLATKLGDTDAALEGFTEAERLFSDAGLPLLAARSRMGHAIALDAAGRHAGAVIAGRDAETAARAAGVRGLDLAHVQANLAGFLLRAGDGADEALGRALAAVTEVERHRYSLTLAGHRQHVLEERERTVYATAIDAARAVGDDDVLASLIEITRTHAVPARNAHHDPGLGTLAAGVPFPLAGPATVTTHAASRAVGAAGDPIVLRELAARVGGPAPTWWLTSWVDRGRITVSAVGSEGTTVSESTVDIDAYLALLACLGVTYPVDREIADTGRGSPPEVTAYRTAVTPLLDDPETALRWAERLSRGQQRAVDDHPAVRLARQEGEAGLLWRLAQQLIPEPLRVHLLTSLDDHRRPVLAVAPVGALGRVPWALLPLRAPARECSPVPRLLDVADIVHVPPASFVASCALPAGSAGDVLAVVDPLDDLPAARAHADGADRVLAGRWLGDPARLATPGRVLAQLRSHPVRALVVAAHLEELSEDHPAESGIVLAAEDTGEAVLSAHDLYRAQLAAPATALLLGCESLGAGTGAEWTGVALGFLARGTHRVVGTLWPTLDDPATTAVERDLVHHVLADPADGRARFLAEQAARWRERPEDPCARPYRWAAYAEVRTRITA